MQRCNVCTLRCFTDGVVKLDPKDFGDRKGTFKTTSLCRSPGLRQDEVTGVCSVPPVFVQLACAFRYGSDDLDVMGLCFRKDIWLNGFQLYPESQKPSLTAMHETLLKKAGDNAYPFTFEVQS